MEEHSNGESEGNLTVETVHEEDERPRALENDESTETVPFEENEEKKDDAIEVSKEDDAILEAVEEKEDVCEGTEEANGIEEIDWVADEGEEALENDGHRSAEHADPDTVPEEDLVGMKMTSEVEEAPHSDGIPIDSLSLVEEKLAELIQAGDGHGEMIDGVVNHTEESVVSISEEVKDAITSQVSGVLDESNVSYIEEVEVEIPEIIEFETELDEIEEKGIVSSSEDVKEAISSQINGVLDEDGVSCIKGADIEIPQINELKTEFNEIGEKGWVPGSEDVKEAISSQINGVLDEGSVSCIKEASIEIPQIDELKEEFDEIGGKSLVLSSEDVKDAISSQINGALDDNIVSCIKEGAIEIPRIEELTTEFDRIGEKGFVEEIGKLRNSEELQKLEEALIEKGKSANIVNKSVENLGISIKESEIANEIGADELIVRVSSPGASWRNCCGILDVLMKSKR